MAVREFSFDVVLPARIASSTMIAELTSRVLESVGRGDEAPTLAREIQAAVRQSGAAANGDCGVSFRARGGRLEIAVQSSGARVWSATRPIP